jgi:hypothetical protein
MECLPFSKTSGKTAQNPLVTEFALNYRRCVSAFGLNADPDMDLGQCDPGPGFDDQKF